MVEWKEISDEAKTGDWVLLDGGELEDQWTNAESRPVVARWELQYEGTNPEPWTQYGWFVSGFDGGYGRLFYDEPKRWAKLDIAP